MDIALVRCKHCGSEAVMVIVDPHTHTLATFMPDYKGGAFVECTGCTAGVSGKTPEEAAVNWNCTSPEITAMHAELTAYKEAEKAGLLVRLPDDTEKKVSIIERALGFKLHEWSKAFIFGNVGFTMPGRQSGRTTALIIKMLLSEGEPIHAFPGGKHYHVIPDTPRGTKTGFYERFFWGEVSSIRNAIGRVGGIRIRDVFFSEEQERNYRRALGV